MTFLGLILEFEQRDLAVFNFLDLINKLNAISYTFCFFFSLIIFIFLVGVAFSSWIFIILSFVLLAVFVKFGKWIFHIALLAQGKKKDFKADAFAVSCGFGKGLLDYLERIKDFDFSGNSIMSKIFATPAVMLRIDELEKALVDNNAIRPIYSLLQQ